MSKYFLLAVFFLGLTAFSMAIEKNGVIISPTKVVDGHELKLNGTALRTVPILKIKAYVAAFYSPEPLSTYEEVINSKGPFRFDFTFLREFNQNDVRGAWKGQFQESASYTYPELDQDVARLNEYFGPLLKYGTQTFELVGDKTIITDQGVIKGTIVGREFQKSFLSLWFGSKPVPRMKMALLGQEGENE